MQFKDGDRVIIIDDSQWGKALGLIGKEGMVGGGIGEYLRVTIPNLSLPRIYHPSEIVHSKQYYLRKYAQSRNT